MHSHTACKPLHICWSDVENRWLTSVQLFKNSLVWVSKKTNKKKGLILLLFWQIERRVSHAFSAVSGQTWTLEAGVVLFGWKNLLLLSKSRRQGSHNKPFNMPLLHVHLKKYILLNGVFTPGFLCCFSCLWVSCRCGKHWYRRWIAPVIQMKTMKQVVEVSSPPIAH